MSSNDSTPPPANPSTPTLLARMPLGCKLLCIGAILAIVASFLNASSTSATSQHDMFRSIGNIRGGDMVIEKWHGLSAVLCCIVSGALALLYIGLRPRFQAKPFSWGAVVLAIFILLESIIAFVMAILVWTNIDFMSNSYELAGMRTQISAGAGLGAYVIVLASATCLAGSGFLARDARMF